MPDRSDSNLIVDCPCCGTRLTIDTLNNKVLSHETKMKRAIAPSLDRVGDLLREQAEKREAIFQKSAQDEKSKHQLLEKRFEDALQKTKGEPVTRPTRDIDLE